MYLQLHALSPVQQLSDPSPHKSTKGKHNLILQFNQKCYASFTESRNYCAIEKDFHLPFEHD